MSFVAGRGGVLLAAATTQYKVEHPRLVDLNSGNVDTSKVRYPIVEIVNATTAMVYVAFDRAVVPPAGNGVQGNQMPYTGLTGPIAATPGDFDLAVPNGSWPAVDDSIPVGSVYMSIYSTAAGVVNFNYGQMLDG